MSDLVAAWQAALAAEYRAAFGYGVLGAHLHGSPQLGLAISCSDAHEALRDSTAQAIASAGLTPVPAAADYPDVYPVDDAAAARALAPRLEDDCAAAWRYLYAVAAATSGPQASGLRRSAQVALTASAVRATRWRGTTDPFPGL
jgi:hypothetical protein